MVEFERKPHTDLEQSYFTMMFKMRDDFEKFYQEEIGKGVYHLFSNGLDYFVAHKFQDFFLSLEEDWEMGNDEDIGFWVSFYECKQILGLINVVRTFVNEFANEEDIDNMCGNTWDINDYIKSVFPKRVEELYRYASPTAGRLGEIKG